MVVELTQFGLCTLQVALRVVQQLAYGGHARIAVRAGRAVVECGVQLCEYPPLLHVLALPEPYGLQVLLFGYLLSQVLREFVVQYGQLLLLSLQFSGHGLEVAAEVADEFVLVLHRVAMVGVVRGAAHRAGRTLLQVSSQADEALALAHVQGVLLVGHQAFQHGHIYGQFLFVLQVLLYLQTQRVDELCLLLYACISAAYALPQALCRVKHQQTAFQFHHPLLHVVTLHAAYVCAVYFAFVLQGLYLLFYVGMLCYGACQFLSGPSLFLQVPVVLEVLLFQVLR